MLFEAREHTQTFENPLRHFREWQQMPASERSAAYYNALTEAEQIHQQKEFQRREALRTSSNPNDQWEYDQIIKQEKVEAARRRAEKNQVPVDPIARPVTAFEIERSSKEKLADMENEQRRIDEMIVSPDPMDQYQLEQDIKLVMQKGRNDRD